MERDIKDKLAELGQACLDWWLDTGNCHFCDPYPGDIRGEENTEHDQGCVLMAVLGKEYLDAIVTMKDVLE